ncbi:hypothetical protein QR680_004569 [Steinernema hermaphroditum]|uniref:Chondroitin proteoglycan 4 domain-containing protein n=1 Tax=Steinernema hermaphroditum TaxID=289476 RepID=A0AA39HQ66_9BILA|nr:hypothetical protein QR680_004569 [Steinernema hermaphroditum]
MLLRGATLLAFLLFMPKHSSSNSAKNHRKIYCLRSCFANLVLTSPYAENKLADRMCPAFQFLPNCLYKCDRSLLRETAVTDLMTRCRVRERRVYRYRYCVDRHLPKIFEECSTICAEKIPKEETASIFDEINSHCRTIKCRLPCTITDLNKRCRVAGNHIFGTYAIPFDAMVTLMKRNGNLHQALIGMPEHCRFLFDIESDGDEDIEEDLVDWDEWKRPRNFEDAEDEEEVTTTTVSSLLEDLEMESDEEKKESEGDDKNMFEKDN